MAKSIFKIFKDINEKQKIQDNNAQNYFEPYSVQQLENLNWNSQNNNLSFQVIKYTHKPKIERYIQRNYNKIPIYSNQHSITKKVLLNFNKNINLKLFCNEQIRNINELSSQDKVYICKTIGYIPQWIELENKINVGKISIP